MFSLAALFMIATSSACGWVPDVKPTYMRLEVGETRVAKATRTTSWGTLMPAPCCDWVFYCSDENVAFTHAVLTNEPIDVPITGIGPGTTWLMIEGFSKKYTRVEVVCGAEDAIVPAQASVAGTIGRPLTLEVITPIANRTTFTWYRGRMGDVSSPLTVSGPEVQFVPQASSEFVWVLAATECSTSSAEFHVTAHASKSRALRR
jgi:hypothetical protein